MGMGLEYFWYINAFYVDFQWVSCEYYVDNLMMFLAGLTAENIETL